MAGLLDFLNKGGSPLLDLGIGLLGAAGPSTMPHSFGQDLARGLSFAQQSQLGRVNNQLRGQLLLDAQRRSQAINQIGGLLGGTVPVPTPAGLISPAQGATAASSLGVPPVATSQVPAISQPQGQEQLMGLLSQANPEQFTSSLIQSQFPQQERAETEFIRSMKAVGINPNSEVGRTLFLEKIKGNDPLGVLAQMQARDQQLRNEERQIKIAADRAAAKASGEQTKIDRGQLRLDIFKQLSDAKKAAAIIDRLEGSMGEPGIGGGTRKNMAGALALAQQAFGVDSAKAKAIADDLQELERLGTGLGFENFKAFNTAISDSKARIAIEKDLSINKNPNPNREALADRIEIALDEANLKGIKVDDEKELRALVKNLREKISREMPVKHPTATEVFDFGEVKRSLIGQ